MTQSAERPAPDRRTFLRTSAVAGVGVAAAVNTSWGVGSATAASPVFRHGVASGDPLPNAVVIWTRITPTADAVPGSGKGPSTAVTWSMATDREFGNVVATGTVTSSAQSDHTIKVDVDGLNPKTVYYYRFSANGVTSPVGTTKTAPAANDAVPRLRFAVVSCSNWEAGYFAAYRHMIAHADLDAVVHLGDYIYEYGVGGYDGKYGVIRKHDPQHEIVSLSDYRRRHAQYKTDTDLQAAHQALPWICTWDDHESANDSYKDGAENHSRAQGPWAERKAHAEQAYFEWMPVRPAADAHGRHLYRRLRFGNLAELSMLDLRTYRDEQVSATKRAIDDPSRSITGKEQMQWLRNGIESSTATWKLVGNPVMITPILAPPLDAQTSKAFTQLLGIPESGIPVNADSWDGYTNDRRQLLTMLRDKKIDNTVFLTGDIHMSWACELPLEPARYPAGSPSLATELVVTSVTSTNLDDIIKVPEHSVGNTVPPAATTTNRQARWLDTDAHGYGIVTITPAATQMDWWFLNAKEDKRSGRYHGASYRVRSRSQRVQRVARPIR